ncbi:MAG: hypothetical protein SCH98_05225 [Deferrisomatales bacterium]|nr:hypothetical protein [Deferrisomatales bacterium]
MASRPNEPAGPGAVTEPEAPPIGEVSTNRIEVLNLALVAAVSVAGLGVSREFATGALAGGVLMAVNFRVIVGVLRKVFLGGRARVGSAAVYWLKFLGLLLLVGVLVLKFRVDVIGFLVGLSTLLVAITAEAVLRLARR